MGVMVVESLSHRARAWVPVSGVLLGLGLVLLAAGAAQAPPADLSVEDPWVREAPAPRTTTAAYMVLRNLSSREIVLTGGSTPAAKVLELHEMIDEGGTMRMRKVERLVIPAKDSLTLRPGGLHLMLIELTRPLKIGEKVPITLTTADGRTIAVEADVRAGGRMHH